MKTTNWISSNRPNLGSAAERVHGSGQRVGRLCTAWLMVLLGLATVLVGCTSGPKISGRDAAGDYDLLGVNGQTVPCEITHGGHPLKVLRGQLTLGRDGTVRSVIDFVGPTGREVRREVDGKYQREGGDLRMRWDRAGTTRARWEADDLVMNNEGMLFRYRLAGAKAGN